MAKKAEVSENLESKKISPIKIVLLIIAAYVCINVLAFVGIFGFAYIVDGNSKLDYEEKDNNIIVKNKDIKVVKEKEAYSEKDECYVINLKIDSNEKVKSGFFKSTGSLDFTFTLYDDEGYVIGEAYAYANDLKNNKKFKIKASYCEDNAEKVTKSKLSELALY